VGSMGYVAATISYRLSDVAPFPAAVQDVKCAARWRRPNAERFHVDPNRIALAGGSAGGHLAMMAGYATDNPELEGTGGHPEMSSRVQAVVNFCGPTDLTSDFARGSDVVVKSRGEQLTTVTPNSTASLRPAPTFHRMTRRR